MYITNQPKIHLSEIVGYDGNKDIYYATGEDVIFEDQKELIEFLAKANIPVQNWDGKEIVGRFKNKYMESQALGGVRRRSRLSFEPEYVFGVFSYKYTTSIAVGQDWKINRYLFWMDMPGKPSIDVRMFKKEVDAEYLRQAQKKMSYADFMARKKTAYKKQGRKSHKCYPWRDDAKYIHRARSAYGMEAEEEYKVFAKRKDKKFKYVWPDEDFGGYHSTGWKDNSGNRCRRQWEPKAEREFEKVRRKKDIAMFSGKKRESPKRRKTKEELLEELDMLRKEFEC